MNSINLLPPEYKKSIAEAKTNTKAVTYLSKTIYILFGFGLIFILPYLLLTINLKNANTALIEKEKDVSVFGNLEDESKKIAERLSTIKQIDAEANHWSNVIEELQKIMPDGIYLTNVKMDDNQKTRATVSGVATNKQQVASLRELMEKSDKFSYVDIETSSTVLDPKTKTEIESFSLSFSLDKEALR